MATAASGNNAAPVMAPGTKSIAEGMKDFADIMLSDDSFTAGLGSSAVIAAATQLGYEGMEYPTCGEDSLRARHKCIVIAFEKKLQKKRRDGGGTIEIRIMVYPDRHVVMVCIFDEQSEGARERNKEDDHDGSLPDDEKYQHGDLLQQGQQVFVCRSEYHRY